eukprot:320269_1
MDHKQPHIDNMPRVAHGYQNSGISINYVPDWGLKEAIRELTQNAVDAMVSWLKNNGGQKKDWKPCLYEFKDDTSNKTYRNFDFTWPTNDNILLGKITYDPLDKELLLENPGTIDKFNLLLGGSGTAKQQNDEDIIGRFGEGMKLAALALLRPTQKPYDNYIDGHTRLLTIKTGGDVWNFKLLKDPNFNNHICLFYKISKLSDKKQAKLQPAWTYTTIHGLTIDEWNNSYKNFLFFCKEEEIMRIPTISPNISHKGELLLEDRMKGQFFVKDLQIKDYGTYHYDEKDDAKTAESFKNGKPESSFYGYNSHKIDLNRDRKSVDNLWHKYAQSSCILADVLNNYNVNKQRYNDAVDELKLLWKVVYWSLKIGKYETYYFHKYSNTAVCDRLWQEWKRDPDYNGIPNVQPLRGDHGGRIERFFREKQLDPQFYPYVVISWTLWENLSKSSKGNYESWTDRFDKLINHAANSNLNEQQINVKQQCVQRIQQIRNGFTAEKLIFKDFIASTSFAKEGKLYVAKELLNDDRKLLAKCLQLLRVSTTDILTINL